MAIPGTPAFWLGNRLSPYKKEIIIFIDFALKTLHKYMRALYNTDSDKFHK
jgi:hypothetical protein